MVLIMNAGLTLALTEVSVIRDNRTALEEVNVGFESGTSVALVGSNGSGKTTMLEVLAGLLAPTQRHRGMSPRHRCDGHTTSSTPMVSSHCW